MQSLRVPILAIFAAVALTTGLAGPALAEPMSGTSARACVVTLQPEGASRTPAQPKCYDDLAAAVRSVTGDTVHIPPHLNTVSQDQLDAGERTAAADRDSSSASKARRIIGIEYKDKRYRGASKVYNVKTRGCAKGSTYRDGSLSDDPMNDEISSARSYDGCTGRHYQHSGFSGMKRDCSCKSMGLMNDRTSAIRWF